MMNQYGKSGGIFDVGGKKAVITGGTKGIGREFAVCLLENGCDVTLAARSTADCEDICSFASKLGRNVYLISCDVTDSASVAAMMEQAYAQMGRIDILICSAGIGNLQHIQEMDDKTWHDVLSTNLDGTFYAVREASKKMIQQKYGKIITISSMKSLLGTTKNGYAAYCASKGGVNMLTKQAACELAKHGITANIIAPTFVKTKISEKVLADEQFRKGLEARIPIGRIGQFDDLMGLMLLFASDASKFITGQVVYMDGGISASQE
ncbi:MAG: SDR family NAD(P)-dependent oxidoreductase [Christensenellales bacterium]